jgi:Predicted membrane protein (DUF2207) C-terminal domain
MAQVAPISVTAVLGASSYYLFAWLLAGRKPNKRSVVPRYEPPAGLSPAMVRYTWKECFDDRTFWCSVLSLVSKDLATIEVEEDTTVLRPTRNAQHPPALPDEERLLLKRVLGASKRKGMAISMLDEKTATVVTEMAAVLRQAAVGKLFLENRNYVIGGILVSLTALCLVARPSGKDEWMALFLGLAVMAPGAFYLLFLVLRILDIGLAAREKLDGEVIRRAAVLFGLAVPCVAAIVLGSVVLTTTFGWPTVTTAALLTGLTLFFRQRLKAPTAAGMEWLDQIEGFRLFLQSVERLPMDREDAPSDHAGVYEKYLPYAVALEVDQKWSDKLVALSSTLHRSEALAAAHSFYLGMWDGKPVEMVFTPKPPGSRGF